MHHPISTHVPALKAWKLTAACGCVQTGPNTVEITELPLHKWTQDYKEFLEELMKPQEKVRVIGTRHACG